jgi:hypothetical protein
MEKNGLSSWNVQLHHSLRHHSVEKGAALTTTLHCLSPSLLSQTLEPSGYQTCGRYGEEPARDAIVQYFPDGESFAESYCAGESPEIHAERYGAVPVTC